MTIVIGSFDHLEALAARVGGGEEVVAFSDTDVPRALEAIVQRRPGVVALERLFAATSRGAALIARIRNDPAMLRCEIRVIAHDSDYVRISKRGGEGPRPAGKPGAESEAQATPVAVAAAEAAPQIQWNITRRAPRVRVRPGLEVLVDGNPATLVDLSTIGAQVLSPTILRPNQRVRMALPEDGRSIRFNATIAWAAYELPRRAGDGPRYRAGIEFADADAGAVEAFGKKNRIKQ